MSSYEANLKAFISQYAPLEMPTFIEHIRQHNVFMLGEFVLKSGFFSPIYIDFRGLISSQQLMNETSYLIHKLITDSAIEYDYIVGVPYAALSLGSRVSLFANKPLLMQRKEAKTYGTKKLIEGIYEQGRRALIIEDVVTTGSSIMETAKVLRNEGLVVEDVICVLDRGQGGAKALAQNNINLHSVLKVSQILEHLFKTKHIDDKQLATIQKELLNPKLADNNVSSPRTWSLKARSEALRSNKLNARLLEIMETKKSNLCVAIDVSEAEQVLKVINEIQLHVCAVKLHVDSLNGANEQFFVELEQLAQSGQFILFEDRKFADIANTNFLQLLNGSHKIASWAHAVTAHSITGVSAIKCFEEVINDSTKATEGVLLVAELSTEDALTNEGAYLTRTVQMAKECNGIVSGFICQKRCNDNLGMLYWSPGVHLRESNDGKGQQWRTVDDAIIRDGNDIVIVGRGIILAEDVKVEAQRYQEAAWTALQTRECFNKF